MNSYGERKHLKGTELKPGMWMNTWFGWQRIGEIEPHNGPFDFVCGIARFAGPNHVGMTITKTETYEVDVHEGEIERARLALEQNRTARAAS